MPSKIESLLRRVYEHQLKEVFERLNSLGIDSILIKGWAAARYYNDPLDRNPGDFDVMLPPGRITDSVRAVTDRFPPDIDLHFGPRHLDTLSFEELFERSESVEIDGLAIHVPCREDHLRMLCVHWLTDGGERKDRLWDIYWAVKSRPREFDWEKCLDVVSKRRRDWVICTIGLAHRYLDLPIDDLPFSEEAKNLPQWFPKAIEKRWKKGVAHLPIHRLLTQPKALFQQLKKRFPPNPVMATITMEGDIRARTRFRYQIGHILKQSAPSLRRIVRRLTSKGE